MIADDLDSRDSIDVFAMIFEEVLMRYFLRCEQDLGCTSARSRCSVLCYVRFRDDDCGRSGQQGQYNYDEYNLRRCSDAIFHAVRAGFMARECKVEMRPAMLCVRFRDVENGRDRQQGQYSDVCYDFRRGIDAIFRAVLAGFRLYECKACYAMCAISRCRERTRSTAGTV